MPASTAWNSYGIAAEILRFYKTETLKL